MTMQVEYGRHISWQVFFLGSKTTTLLYTDYNFLCEQKEHVMIPHNSNKTSWVIFGPYIILQVCSLMGVETIFRIGFWSNSQCYLLKYE